MDTTTIASPSEDKDTNATTALKSQKTLKDALAFAAKNREFCEHLVEDPALFQAEYNLSAAQVQQIKQLKNFADSRGGLDVRMGYEDTGGNGGGGGGNGGNAE